MRNDNGTIAELRGKLRDLLAITAVAGNANIANELEELRGLIRGTAPSAGTHEVMYLWLVMRAPRLAFIDQSWARCLFRMSGSAQGFSAPLSLSLILEGHKHRTEGTLGSLKRTG